MGKRGISAVIATVLMILITIAGVTIVWVIIVPMIKENISFEQEMVDLNIETSAGYTVWDNSTGNVTVQVKRGADNGEIIGIQFVISRAGNSVTLSSSEFPAPNQAKLYEFNAVALVGGKPDSIKVASIFRTKIGSVTSEITKLPSGITSNVDGIVPTNQTILPLPQGECNVADDCANVSCKTKDCVSGSCVYTNVASGTSCEDGNLCTLSDQCSLGTCISGTPKNCNDNEECTTDSCSAGNCQNIAVPNGTVCSVGLCQGGTCQPQGTAIYNIDIPKVISAPGNYYLAEDLYCSTSGDCIQINGNGDNVVINGHGKKIVVNVASQGIYIYGVPANHVIGTNLSGIAFEIKNNLKGIYANYADNFNISNSTFTFLDPGTNPYGVFVINSNLGIIENNVFSASFAGYQTGVYITETTNNKIVSNTMNVLYYGIVLYPGGVVGTQINDNTISNSINYGVYIAAATVTGTSLSNNKICSGGLMDIYNFASCLTTYHSGNKCDSAKVSCSGSCVIPCT